MISGQTFYNDLLLISFLVAVIVFITLFFFTAPYGRHIKKGWGPTVRNKVAWVVMEAASPLFFGLCFITGNNHGIAPWVFLGMWEAHYLHRAFIYPFSLRGDRLMPISIISFGLIFNLMNAYLNGYYIFTLSTQYTTKWLSDPRFIGGVTLFIAGYLINRSADRILRNLRAPGETGYKIPQKGLYRWISCPNYLGEIVVWSGWALATWSLPGLAFAVWTIANLAPRARSHHTWYQETFPDYPAERKALVPWMW
jgi:protein-S-isoprenylcysteine O-methyltransferase Ste14